MDISILLSEIIDDMEFCSEKTNKKTSLNTGFIQHILSLFKDI